MPLFYLDPNKAYSTTKGKNLSLIKVKASRSVDGMLTCDAKLISLFLMIKLSHRTTFDRLKLPAVHVSKLVSNGGANW